MSLYETIASDIKKAMKSRDQDKLSVLRMMKSKIMVVNARGDLNDDEIQKILRTYEKNLLDAMDQSKKLGRKSDAEQLRKEIDVVSFYLPKKLSEENTITLVEKIISDTNAQTKKEMGIVMKAIMSSGEIVDGKLVKSIVDQRLS